MGMKILALEPGFPPELASGRLPFEFARELARRGHEVTVVTMFPRKYLLSRDEKLPKRKFFYWKTFGRVKVLYVWPQFASKSVVSRALEYLIVPFSLFVGGLMIRKKDIIHYPSDPLILPLMASLLAQLSHSRKILRIQDIHPDALVKIGLIKNKLLISFLEFIERFGYLTADHITVIAEGYRAHVVSKGISNKKVSLIPNWANIDEINPPNENDFKEKMKLSDKFLVTYAGTMSWPQDLETVVEAADILRNRYDIMFLIVGDGVKKETLVRRSMELKLDNIMFMPLQPRDEYFKILYASDVCLVPLRKQFTSPTLPSKMLEIMACGKPMIANVPFDSDVRKMVENVGCGVWVEPEKPKDFSKAVLALHDNRALAVKLGENGLFYLRNHLTLKACMDRYEKLLNSLVKLGK